MLGGWETVCGQATPVISAAAIGPQRLTDPRGRRRRSALLAPLRRLDRRHCGGSQFRRRGRGGERVLFRRVVVLGVDVVVDRRRLFWRRCVGRARVVLAVGRVCAVCAGRGQRKYNSQGLQEVQG